MQIGQLLLFALPLAIAPSALLLCRAIIDLPALQRLPRGLEFLRVNVIVHPVLLIGVTIITRQALRRSRRTPTAALREIK